VIRIVPLGSRITKLSIVVAIDGSWAGNKENSMGPGRHLTRRIGRGPIQGMSSSNFREDTRRYLSCGPVKHGGWRLERCM
jgi:hypothetical protein